MVNIHIYSFLSRFQPPLSTGIWWLIVIQTLYIHIVRIFLLTDRDQKKKLNWRKILRKVLRYY